MVVLRNPFLLAPFEDSTEIMSGDTAQGANPSLILVKFVERGSIVKNHIHACLGHHKRESVRHCVRHSKPMQPV